MNGKQTVLNEPIPGTLLRDYQAEIVEILRGNLTPKHMRQKLLDYHENDIAQALERLETDGRGRLYRLLDAETLADVLGYSDSLGTYLAELPIRKQVAVLSRLEITDAVEALRAMDKEQRKTLTELLSDEMRQEIRLLSSFDEDEIGSRMSTNYIAVRADLSVRGVMRELVAQAAENDNVSRIYVLDEDGILVGAIDLKDLIIAREGTPLESIVMSSYPYVYANEPVDACVER
ncbi:MAG: magnesium transporter, partial [Clostridia bacterium]|nr:magnesium transporter [Clostridia bacterium]